MKAGKYYIGDLCYVLRDEIWDEVCGLLFHGWGNVLDDGLHKLKDGREFYIFSTAHGDGVYKDQVGFEYAIDSGTIGCILADSVKLPERGKFRVVDLPDAYSYVDGGTLYFGNVIINTDGEEDEDEDDWSDDYSDEFDDLDDEDEDEL